MTTKQVFNTSAELNYPTVLPTLDLDFANSKTLDPRITFTRSSGGSYVGADGLIKYAGVNEARFDHDPVTGESLGLLVEQARTNLQVWSEDFRNTADAGATRPWTYNTSTVTADNTTAPNGINTADLIAGAAGTANKFLLNNVSASATGFYTFSIYLKQGTEQFVVVRLTDGSTNGVRARFSLTDGTSVITNEGTATGQAAVATAVGNGWFRCSVSCSVLALPFSVMQPQLWLNKFASTSLTTNYFAWGAQLEAGAFPTSYIPTTTAAATRSADVASITGSAFSSWYSQSGWTLFSDSTIIASQIKTQIAWELGGGSYASSLRQPQSTSNQFRALVAGVFSTAPGTGANLTTGVSQAAVAFSDLTGRLQVGTAGVDITVTNTPDPNVLNIGSSGGGTQLNGTIRRLTYWPKRLPNSQLQALTR
jgi:hypothetical protein